MGLSERPDDADVPLGTDGQRTRKLRGDETLLAQYLTVLGPGLAGASQQQHHLADSLRYLAFRRLIPTHK